MATSSSSLSNSFELEVCVDTLHAAVQAELAGATRIELNTSLCQDGLTPSVGICRVACELLTSPVVCMVRPHNDGFAYSADEKRAMLYDCDSMLSAGAAGLVIGALREGQLDIEFLSVVRKAVGDAACIMHRAFDLIADKQTALEQLVDLGFCRVLTSGGAAAAVDTLDVLASLHESAAGRIEILPGGGVSSRNAAKILGRAPVRQLHGSFRGPDGLPSSSEIQAVRDALQR